MNIVINADFSSVTTTEDGTKEMVFGPRDPENPSNIFTSKAQALAVVEKYKSNSRYWFPVAVASTSKVLNPVAFMGLFTLTEAVNLRAFALSDDPTAPYIAELLRRLDHPALKEVNVLSPDVQAGLDLFVSSGILTVERRAEIEAI